MEWQEIKAFNPWEIRSQSKVYWSGTAKLLTKVLKSRGKIIWVIKWILLYAKNYKWKIHVYHFSPLQLREFIKYIQKKNISTPRAAMVESENFTFINQTSLESYWRPLIDCFGYQKFKHETLIRWFLYDVEAEETFFFLWDWSYLQNGTQWFIFLEIPKVFWKVLLLMKLAETISGFGFIFNKRLTTHDNDSWDQRNFSWRSRKVNTQK